LNNQFLFPEDDVEKIGIGTGICLKFSSPYFLSKRFMESVNEFFRKGFGGIGFGKNLSLDSQLSQKLSA